MAFGIIVDSPSCNIIYTRLVLEYLPILVDFTVKLNLNDKQRGALSKLQHFVGNRMSRDIMMPVLGDHVEWMLRCSIGSKYLGLSSDSQQFGPSNSDSWDEVI